ncbi:hypothetical protein ABIE67_000172 [Streptomyces sp. V4I8]|uniref:hypothetical protein n=1 Tax=Streptomyces sp. V4I8 TaxID=3156469 RepID=UPI0035195BA6
MLRNRQLEAEVRELRDQLARVLGQQRAAAVTSSGETSSPGHHTTTQVRAKSGSEAED